MSWSRTVAGGGSTGAWIRLVAVGVLAGLVVTALTPVVAEAGRRFIALGFLGLAVGTVAVASNRAREILLFVWVVSLTYNRQFWSFSSLVGDYGAFGPYWMVSDLILLLLIGQWLFEAAVLKKPQVPRCARFLPWYAPFAIVAFLSVLGAAQPGWALGDLLRVFKLGLVLMYFRYNVGTREWWVILAGLGAAVVIQCLFGVLEVISGRTGVLWIFGLGGSDAGAVLGIDTLFGGWTRATGTVAHPPYLAAFLLLTVPIFASLSLTLRPGKGRWLAAGVAVFGAVGMVCTLARLPVVLMVGQMLLLMVLLAGLRRVSVIRLIATGAFAGLLLTSLGMAAADLVYERLTRDFDESVDRRVEEYKVAASMLYDHPLLGVGLNNYAAHMATYGSNTVWGIEQRWHDAAVNVTHMRLLAGPLNGMLYVATVTGVLGLVTFLWLALGGLALAWRRARFDSGPQGAACLGMAVGMAGVYLHQSLSYSIWIDTVMSVWIVLIGLAGCALQNRARTDAA